MMAKWGFGRVSENTGPQRRGRHRGRGPRPPQARAMEENRRLASNLSLGLSMIAELVAALADEEPAAHTPAVAAPPAERDQRPLADSPRRVEPGPATSGAAAAADGNLGGKGVAPGPSPDPGDGLAAGPSGAASLSGGEAVGTSEAGAGPAAAAAAGRRGGGWDLPWKQGGGAKPAASPERPRLLEARFFASIFAFAASQPGRLLSC